jgi:HPt (histidine-containing phosphotransfer) domain-containing protein
LGAALEEQRLEAARAHAHSLKSFAVTVGANQLRSALERIERATTMGDVEGARQNLSVARLAFVESS